jgi:hypothetical protein
MAGMLGASGMLGVPSVPGEAGVSGIAELAEFTPGLWQSSGGSGTHSNRTSSSDWIGSTPSHGVSVTGNTRNSGVSRTGAKPTVATKKP